MIDLEMLGGAASSPLKLIGAAALRLHPNLAFEIARDGRAVVDIFRVTEGKISEHWDAVQEIPEKSANSNTMF